MMARPSNSADTTKKHMTKDESEQRKKAEKALTTGEALRERSEVKANPKAHSEFLRVNKVLSRIGKNDAIYEAIINRYCMLHAECIDYIDKRETFYQQLCELQDSDVVLSDKYKIQAGMQRLIIDMDKQIQAKRKMMFDIEKENAMTISAALRSIPKSAQPEKNPLLDALSEIE